MTNSRTGSLRVQEEEERITRAQAAAGMFHRDTHTNVKTATTEMVRASCAVRMRYTCPGRQTRLIKGGNGRQTVSGGLHLPDEAVSDGPAFPPAP